MRLVSLLPAATEWVCAFGGAADLVGRSHACDHPPAMEALPAVTRPAFAAGGDAANLDAHMQQRLREALCPFEVDLERLRDLSPDVVLTQSQCDVCAVSRSQLEAALADWIGARPRLFSMQPATLKDVLDAALRLGRTIGRMEAAMAFLAKGEQRLRTLRARLGLPMKENPADAPTVACIEWVAPLMTAGHWVPDVVDRAGGRAVLAEPGARSPRLFWDDLHEADPDVLVLSPCSFTLEATGRDLHYLTDHPGWSDLHAVREGRVFLFDGNVYFNRPGPGLYRTVELLAAALHPDRLSQADLKVQPWEFQALA